MFSLTSRERKILLIVALIIAIGAALRYLQLKIKTLAITLTSPAYQPAGIVININKASGEELEKIPGIGPEFARRILEYREKNGDFKILQDLRKVKGIGEKKLQQMKERITL